MNSIDPVVARIDLTFPCLIEVQGLSVVVDAEMGQFFSVFR